MISNTAYKKLFAVSFSAVVIALAGNITVWSLAAVERERVQDYAERTNQSQVCLLKRAKQLVQRNDTNAPQEQIDRAVAFYDQEIDFLDGKDVKCPQPQRAP